MIMYKLKWFTKGDGMCADDFNEDRQVEYINTQQISSIAGITEFYLPLIGGGAGLYSVVTMQNRDRFYIDEKEFNKISKALSLEGAERQVLD